MRSFIHEYRSELLMWIFVALLAASPLTDLHPRIGFVMSLMLFLVLMAGTTFLAPKRMVLLRVYPLAGLWLAAHIAQILFGETFHVSPYIGLALSCAIIWGILSRFSGTATFSSRHVAEAVIVYLMIAVAFSQLYWILNRHLSNCFLPPVPRTQQSEFLYFSLSTLTTLGFGDILPVNHYVRFVAAFEAVAGVFYLAVIIARLVAGLRVGPRGAE
jgi:Ion channel